MNANTARYSIKIPDNVEILTNQKQGYVLIKGNLCKKLYKLLFKITVCNTKKMVYVTDNTFKKLSNNKKKQQKSLRGTAVAMLSNHFLEVSSLTYKKLNLVGVGYKVFELPNQILHFKLGFSHSIYYNVPVSLTTNCHQSIKLVIAGNDSKLVTHTAGLIKKLKKPEPYKGKGILYSTDRVKLKEGKKV